MLVKFSKKAISKFIGSKNNYRHGGCYSRTTAFYLHIDKDGVRLIHELKPSNHGSESGRTLTFSDLGTFPTASHAFDMSEFLQRWLTNTETKVWLVNGVYLQIKSDVKVLTTQTA
jgi:hypothetical protein